MKNNDNQIELLQLKVAEKEDQLAKQKESLGKTKTKLVLNMSGNTFNLNVLSKNDLTLLLGQLYSIGVSLGSISTGNNEVLVKAVDDFLLDGYNLGDWIDDVTYKLTSISIKEEEAKLKVIKKTLADKLSEDRKTELELEQIAQDLL